MINLNYAVFLYNTGDRKAAVKQFSAFEQKLQQLKGAGIGDMDPEVRTGGAAGDEGELEREWDRDEQETERRTIWNSFIPARLVSEKAEIQSSYHRSCFTQLLALLERLVENTL